MSNEKRIYIDNNKGDGSVDWVELADGWVRFVFRGGQPAYSFEASRLKEESVDEWVKHLSEKVWWSEDVRLAFLSIIA